MKTLNLFLVISFAILVISCVTDAKDDKIDDADSVIVEQPTTIQDTMNAPSIAAPDTSDTKSAQTKESGNKPKLTAEQIKRAKDLEAMIRDKVNTNPNPDNYNGQVDDKGDKNYTFNLVPILSDDDKNFYFVQFFESPSKLSKDDLRKYGIKEDIFVVFHGGVFKYCISKSKTEDEATKLKPTIAKKYKLKNLTVETYGEAF